jgi:hypothetical protein
LLLQNRRVEPLPAPVQQDRDEGKPDRIRPQDRARFRRRPTSIAPIQQNNSVGASRVGPGVGPVVTMSRRLRGTPTGTIETASKASNAQASAQFQLGVCQNHACCAATAAASTIARASSHPARNKSTQRPRRIRSRRTSRLASTGSREVAHNAAPLFRKRISAAGSRDDCVSQWGHHSTAHFS